MDPNNSAWFGGLTGGQALFIGDYNGLAIGSDGVAWPAGLKCGARLRLRGRRGQNIFVAGVAP